MNIATNTNGDAIVTYIQISNSNPRTVQLWARRYSVTTNSFATNPSLVFDSGSLDAYVPPSVALDDAGNATVAFAVETSTGYQVQTSRTVADRSELAGGPDRDGDGQRREERRSEQHDRTRDHAGPAHRSRRQRHADLAQAHRRQRQALRSGGAALHGGRLGPAGRDRDAHDQQRLLADARGSNASGTSVATWYFGTSLDVQANVFH